MNMQAIQDGRVRHHLRKKSKKLQHIRKTKNEDAHLRIKKPKYKIELLAGTLFLKALKLALVLIRMKGLRKMRQKMGFQALALVMMKCPMKRRNRSQFTLLLTLIVKMPIT